MTSDWFEDGDLAVDFRGCRVWLRGKEIRVSALRFKILSCLIENAGRPVTSIEILRYAWDDINYDMGLVRWHIARLRREIGDNPPTRIVHVRGFGYRYDPVAPVTKSAPSRPSRFHYVPRDYRRASCSSGRESVQPPISSSRCYHGLE